MFEQAVNRIIGYYNFDPLQLALIEQKDGREAIRVQYLSGDGEVVLDFPLNDTKVTGLEESLENAINFRAAIKLKVTQTNTFILHLAKYDEKRSKYIRGSFGVLQFKFLPVSSIACTASHNSVLNFLTDLQALMNNNFHSNGDSR